MTKSMMAAALILAVGASAASAQQFAAIGNTTDYTQRQAPQQPTLVDGTKISSAIARNVGPTSSVTGFSESDLGSAASGNTENPLAPSASGNGLGGN